MNISSMLNDYRVISVSCSQWGDTGKGKIVEFIASVWADVIVRGTGGANAGHTVCFDGKTYILHQVPSAIHHEQKTCVIGSGVVLDPAALVGELKALRATGVSCENLMISHRANLVLPQHRVVEAVREMSPNGKIGTTGRGIGPAYVDHYDRIGLVVNDLLNPDCMREKLKRNLEPKTIILNC